jgi:hypothetical protein
LENDFNAGIAKAQMVIMQEADQKKASDKVYNRLKDMITSETVRLEPKGVDARMVPARFNFMLQSNHIDVLPLEAFDRRFFVAEIANKELENNIPYFDPKFQWMRAEGAAIIMNWLLKRDLSSFNPAAQPPMTEAKLRMRESTVPPWEAWIQENILDDRGLDHRCYTSRELLWIAEGCLQPMEMIPQNRVNSFSQTLARMGVKKARGADGGSRVKVKIGGKLQPTTIWVMWGGVYSEIGWAKEYEGSRVKVVASNPATNPATDPEKF